MSGGCRDSYADLVSDSRDVPASGGPGGVDRRLTDGLLASTQTLTVALVIAADLERTGRATAGAYLFAVGFGALVLAGRRAPRLVLALTVLGIFVYYSRDFPPIGIALPAVAVLYRAADVGALRWAVGSGAVLVGVAAWARVYDGLPTTYLLSYELLTNAALVTPRSSPPRSPSASASAPAGRRGRTSSGSRS
jgi:hypothetical protein